MNNGILLSGEVDFMVKGIFSYHIFGQEVWITTTHVCMSIVILSIIVFCVLAKRSMLRAEAVPGGFQNIAELVVELLDGVVEGSMGKNAIKFANYIGTIFIFILLSNISGLFGLRPPTADYGVTLPLGVITFCLIFFNKIKYQKVSGFLKGLCEPWPIWAPINVIRSEERRVGKECL